MQLSGERQKVAFVESIRSRAKRPDKNRSATKIAVQQNSTTDLQPQLIEIGADDGTAG
jgi:hypothetical protein